MRRLYPEICNIAHPKIVRKIMWMYALLPMVALLVSGSRGDLSAAADHDDAEDFYSGTFPDGFLWGAATSAYQVEGGWNVNGKSMGMWDYFTNHVHPGGATGNVACDSFNKYAEDIKMLKEIGVDFYRFSISWSRVIHAGDGEHNQLGLQYYDSLINALLAEGITPMVTIYHLDLPQALQDMGGWENDDIDMPGKFRNYANLCFERFGDRVKWWFTFNGPWLQSVLGYGKDRFAPGVANTGISDYRAAHNIIKAHAEAWHVYDENHRATQNGRVSIALDSDWKEPATADQADVEAAERALQFRLGWFAHPIFVDGDYPDVMKERVAAKSEQQNLNNSRLPEFTAAEKARIKGTYDFFAINHYSTVLVRNCETNVAGPSYEDDKEACESSDPAWPTSGSEWLRMVPWGLRKLLNFIKDNYGDPEIIITENGMSDKNATLQDDHRTYYYRHYLSEALKAIDTDNVNLKGYTVWSLMDNFHWDAAYTEKFGMYYVDFDDDARPRVAKNSSREYASIIKNNGLVVVDDVTEGPINCGNPLSLGLFTALFSGLVMMAALLY